VPAPHVWMVAVPETAGVHWKTRSGEVPELPQLPASWLVPLVVPLKVPPCAGTTAGLLQLPTRVVVVVDIVVVDVVVEEILVEVVVVEVVVVEVVVVAQVSVWTFTLPLFDDWFPAQSIADTA